MRRGTRTLLILLNSGGVVDIVFLETEGPLRKRVDDKYDSDEREEDAVDVDVGKR